MTAAMTGHLVGTFEPGSPEWHAARAGGIGASEIAAVLGLSPWESPFSLWQRKAGRIGDAPETEEMTWGRYLEEPIARRFADQHPDLTVYTTGTWRSLDRTWQLVNPDRLAHSDDGPVPVECKFAPYSYEDFGASGTDEIPVHYRCQLLQQIDVLGAPYGWLVALVGASYREYRIDADPLDIGVMRSAGERFWNSLPTAENPAGWPPDIDDSDHTYHALKDLHRDVERRDAEVPFDLVLRLRQAVAADEAADAELQQARNELLDAMGTARRAVCAREQIALRVPYPNGSIHLRLTKPGKPAGQKVTEAL